MESIEELEEEIRQLKALKYNDDICLPVEWLLTASEATVMRTLASGRLTTKDQILGALTKSGDDPVEIKIVDVFICKIRKKISPLGYSIITHWGRGYSLPPETLQTIKSMQVAA